MLYLFLFRLFLTHQFINTVNGVSHSHDKFFELLFYIDVIVLLVKQTIFFVFQSLRHQGQAQTIQILL